MIISIHLLFITESHSLREKTLLESNLIWGRAMFLTLALFNLPVSPTGGREWVREGWDVKKHL